MPDATQEKNFPLGSRNPAPISTLVLYISSGTFASLIPRFNEAYSVRIVPNWFLLGKPRVNRQDAVSGITQLDSFWSENLAGPGDKVLEVGSKMTGLVWGKLEIPGNQDLPSGRIVLPESRNPPFLGSAEGPKLINPPKNGNDEQLLFLSDITLQR